MIGLRTLVPAVLLASCLSGPMPPDSAGPEVVLEAYLQALVHGDCATARELALDSLKKGNGDLCEGTRVLSFRIEDLPPARPSENEAVYSTRLVTTGSDDGSIWPGDLMWFYDLKREPNGPWRVAGGGTGP